MVFNVFPTKLMQHNSYKIFINYETCCRKGQKPGKGDNSAGEKESAVRSRNTGDYAQTTLSMLDDEDGQYIFIDAVNTFGFRFQGGIRTIGSVALFPKSVLHWNAQAVSTFNYLNSERRAVAAGLIPPSYLAPRDNLRSATEDNILRKEEFFRGDLTDDMAHSSHGEFISYEGGGKLYKHRDESGDLQLLTKKEKEEAVKERQKKIEKLASDGKVLSQLNVEKYEQKMHFEEGEIIDYDHLKCDKEEETGEKIDSGKDRKKEEKILEESKKNDDAKRRNERKKSKSKKCYKRNLD
ncbi:hypothetical protein KUTeg_006612 [Tegillarca granosa]|uniref:Uncharacterized protein n=1 Tax=Tegillarca granosa TaxID=220873 RepID=A0ABQ9FDA0_TEGGR|nr:hypothetical protein KUTeg_006612 [Tegillarca granosa]